MVLRIFRFPNLFCFQPRAVLGPRNTSLSSSLLHSQVPRNVRAKTANKSLRRALNICLDLKFCWIGAFLWDRSVAHNPGSPQERCWYRMLETGCWFSPRNFVEYSFLPNSSETNKGIEMPVAVMVADSSSKQHHCSVLQLSNYLFPMVKCSHKEREDISPFNHKFKVHPENWMYQGNPVGRCSLTTLPMRLKKWKQRRLLIQIHFYSYEKIWNNITPSFSTLKLFPASI